MKITIRKQTTEENQIEIEEGCYMIHYGHLKYILNLKSDYLEHYYAVYDIDSLKIKSFEHKFVMPPFDWDIEHNTFAQEALLRGMRISDVEFVKEASKIYCDWNGTSSETEEVAA